MNKVIKAFLVVVILMVGILGLSAANAATGESCTHEVHLLNSTGEAAGVSYIFNTRRIDFVERTRGSNRFRIRYSGSTMDVMIPDPSTFFRKFERCA